MENRRGSGIFLGVVSVATLIVAIMGATFAFFSASETATTPVNVTAYEFDADVKLTQVLPETDNKDAKLIPLDADGIVANTTDTQNLLYALNTAKCVTEIKGVKYLACALYKLEVTNHGSAQIVMDGELRTTEHSSTIDGNSFKHLTYQPLTGTEGNLALGTGAEILPLEVYSTEAEANNENAVMELERLTIDPEETETRYFAVYLDEQGELNNSEMGSTYTGQITYTDSTSGSKLTATFSAAN